MATELLQPRGVLMDVRDLSQYSINQLLHGWLIVFRAYLDAQTDLGRRIDANPRLAQTFLNYGDEYYPNFDRYVHPFSDRLQEPEVVRALISLYRQQLIEGLVDLFLFCTLCTTVLYEICSGRMSARPEFERVPYYTQLYLHVFAHLSEEPARPFTFSRVFGIVYKFATQLCLHHLSTKIESVSFLYRGDLSS